ncbi:MAG: hypothetical protein ACRDNO_00335 [Trebonia sp.]
MPSGGSMAALGIGYLFLLATVLLDVAHGCTRCFGSQPVGQPEEPG